MGSEISAIISELHQEKAQLRQTLSELTDKIQQVLEQYPEVMQRVKMWEAMAVQMPGIKFKDVPKDPPKSVPEALKNDRPIHHVKPKDFDVKTKPKIVKKSS